MNEAFPTHAGQAPIDFSVMIGFPVGSVPEQPAQGYMPNVSATAPATTSAPILSMLTPRNLLEPFRVRAKDLEAAASGIKVTSDEDQAKATNLAGQIKKAIKAIEDARKVYVTPFNDHVKEVNGLAGEIRQPLERAEKTLKAGLSTYATEQELARRKAEEEARKAAEEQQRRLNDEAAAAGVVAPIVPEVVQPDTTTTVRTAGGTSYMRTTWDFELKDMAMVPAEYLCLDEKKVRAAISAGVRSIPGLNILERHSVAIRS